mmetsp:Transcript_82385/g.137511  ORF Transcript_82385/g.137511 Transcript_82385/m.137511 type:complete len:234 (-) Transcript_82385:507-1208(-)
MPECTSVRDSLISGRSSSTDSTEVSACVIEVGREVGFLTDACLSMCFAIRGFTSGSCTTSRMKSPWCASARSSTSSTLLGSAVATRSPCPPYACASLTKSGLRISQPEGGGPPTGPQVSWATRPSTWFTSTMTSSCFTPNCLSVASSLMLIWIPPSPATATTRRSGRSDAAAMAAQREYPIVPNRMEASMRCWGLSRHKHRDVQIVTSPTSTHTTVPSSSRGLSSDSRRPGWQ